MTEEHLSAHTDAVSEYYKLKRRLNLTQDELFVMKQRKLMMAGPKTIVKTADTAIEEKKKKCSVCGEFKPYSEFYKTNQKGNVLGLTSECKECLKKKRNNKYLVATQARLKQIELLPDDTKQCRLCGKTKPLTEFYYHPMKKKSVFDECKECLRERAKRRKNELRNTLHG